MHDSLLLPLLSTTAISCSLRLILHTSGLAEALLDLIRGLSFNK